MIQLVCGMLIGSSQCAIAWIAPGQACSEKKAPCPRAVAAPKRATSGYELGPEKRANVANNLEIEKARVIL